MRQVNTKRGAKWVENVPPSEDLWTLWKSTDRPEWLSARKWQDEWGFSVWGDTEGEVTQRLAILPTLKPSPEAEPQHEPIDEADIPFDEARQGRATRT